MTLRLLLLEIRKRLLARSLDLSDLIEEADRRNLGWISRTTFERILSSRAIQFSVSEMGILESEFRFPDNPNRIDYRKFLEVYANPPPDTDPVPSCDSVLNEFKQYLQIRRIDFLASLQPFDRAKRATVTKADFVRAFKDFKGSSEIADAFARKSDGLIPYREIVTALADLPSENSIGLPPAFNHAAQQIEDRQIDIAAWFKRFDRGNKGRLVPEQFRAALATAGLRLTNPDTAALTVLYADGDHVNYTEFLDDLRRPAEKPTAPTEPEFNVDDVVTALKADFQRRRLSISDLFAHAEEPISLYTFRTTLQGVKVRLSVPEIEFLAKAFGAGEGLVDIAALIAELEPVKPPVTEAESPAVQSIIEWLSEHKVAIGPRLALVDRDRTGEIPVGELSIALRKLGLSLPPRDLETVQKFFPGQAPGTIQWEAFTAYVDPDLGEAPPPPEAPAPPPEVADVLAVVREAGRREGISVSEELRKRDRQRKGVVTGTTFIPIMKALLPRLPSSRLHPLVNFYGPSEFRVDDFCRDVEEAAELAQPKGEKESNGIGKVLKRVKAHLVVAGASVGELFRAVDPGRHGDCRGERVATCLGTVKLDLGEEDLTLLLKSFEVESHPERFDYRALSKALEGVPMNRAAAALELQATAE
jgi:Ca2+-binding EF-hand superfamily protein